MPITHFLRTQVLFEKKNLFFVFRLKKGQKVFRKKEKRLGKDF